MKVLTQTNIFYFRKSYVKGCTLPGSFLVKSKPQELRETEKHDILHKSQMAQAILGLWWHKSCTFLLSLDQKTANYLTIQKKKVMQLCSKPKQKFMANLQ